MASPPLVIRNLTSSPIELKLVEHIEASGGDATSRIPGGFAAGLDSITKGVADLVSNSSAPAPDGPHADPNAKPFKKDEADVTIKPFALKKTEIKPTVKSKNEVVRLTFEVEGQQYKIVCPSPKDESQAFAPVAKNPKLHLTGVFLPQASQLTVFSTANLDKWMKSLGDSLPLSALSIPGTHDTPTCYTALPSVRCQSCTPREQLDNGVRFFDIRVQVEDAGSDKLQLVHGVFPISLTGPKYFRELLDDTIDFLNKNPSETVIMSFKREGTGNGTDQQLAKILYDFYCGPKAKGANKWYTTPAIPTLGEARGKIVMFRRFGFGDDVKQALGGARGWGINAETWADNTPCDTHGMVCVQDFYEVLETENIDKKIAYAKAQCEKAGNCPINGAAGGGGGGGNRGVEADDEGGHGPGQRGGRGGGRGGQGEGRGGGQGRGGRGGGRGGHGGGAGGHQEEEHPHEGGGGGGGGGGKGGAGNHLFVNFLSASNFWKAGCWPEKIAAKLNPAIVEHLCLKHHLDYSDNSGTGGTGIVVLDWVGYQGDWDIVRCIVGMNAKLEGRG